MEKLVAAIVADSPRRSRLSLFLLAVHSSRRLSRSLISFAVLNRGRAFFGTDTGTPVRGLRPVRAFQIVTENVPNPRSSIRLPHASAAVISSNIASTIFSTSRRRRCGLRCRKRQTRSDLIIPNSLWAVAGIGNAADLGFFLMASLWPNLQCRRSCKHCVLVDSAGPVACSPACSAAFVGGEFNRSTQHYLAGALRRGAGTIPPLRAKILDTALVPRTLGRRPPPIGRASSAPGAQPSASA